jgi:MYXO-CTERM domain-containing protein
VPGDVQLLEIPGTPPSDLLRWLDDGRLFVYSDRPEPGEIPSPADFGLPPNRQGSLLTLQETGPENGINGLFGYMPTPNQPGFMGNSAGGAVAVYNFTSDTPEPASLGVATIGGIALLRRRRRPH